EHHAALVAVDAGEVATVSPLGVVFVEGRDHAGHVAVGRLDLDDVGAEVGEQHGAERAGQRLGQIDDADTVQWTGRSVAQWRRSFVQGPEVAVRAHLSPQSLRRFTSTVRSPSNTTRSSWVTPQCLNRTSPASSRSGAGSTASTSVKA